MFGFFCLFCSIFGGRRAAADEPNGKEDSAKGRLLWTLSWHPAQFHEGLTCCQHQLCGVRVHALWPRDSEIRRGGVCAFVCDHAGLHFTPCLPVLHLHLNSDCLKWNHCRCLQSQYRTYLHHQAVQWFHLCGISLRCTHRR